MINQDSQFLFLVPVVESSTLRETTEQVGYTSSVITSYYLLVRNTHVERERGLILLILFCFFGSVKEEQISKNLMPKGSTRRELSVAAVCTSTMNFVGRRCSFLSSRELANLISWNSNRHCRMNFFCLFFFSSILFVVLLLFCSFSFINTWTHEFSSLCYLLDCTVFVNGTKRRFED
jgi:hypothetical protein